MRVRASNSIFVVFFCLLGRYYKLTNVTTSAQWWVDAEHAERTRLILIWMNTQALLLNALCCSRSAHIHELMWYLIYKSACFQSKSEFICPTNKGNPSCCPHRRAQLLNLFNITPQNPINYIPSAPWNATRRVLYRLRIPLELWLLTRREQSFICTHIDKNHNQHPSNIYKIN